jgi:hypothetical protein
MKNRMKKKIAVLACTVSASALLSACGDEITEVLGNETVAEVKDLAECGSGNEGDLVYVKEASTVFLCSDNV